jgi:hypothetical protein
MYPHHHVTIDRLTQHYRHDPAILALLVVGSVARGDARADSDVDCMMIVSDHTYREREAMGQLSFEAAGLGPGPDGQAGGIIRTEAYLRWIAEAGNEPARFSLVKAIPLLSRLPDLEALLARGATYPEHQRLEKLRSFHSQLPVHFSYLELGEYSRNSYLLAETAAKLVLFGGRLLLAHNRVLYPGRKWFMRELGSARDKPEGIMELASELIGAPGTGRARAFLDSLAAFQEWPVPPEGCWDRFRRDSEQHWFNGGGPVEDC